MLVGAYYNISCYEAERVGGGGDDNIVVPEVRLEAAAVVVEEEGNKDCLDLREEVMA